MMVYLVGIFMLGLAVAKEESQFSNLINGRVFDLGSYDAKVEIGVLPDRYPHMTEKDKKASYNIRRLLELLRGSFPTGIDKIPSLDPYINNNISPIPLNRLNVPFLSGQVDVAQLTITGLHAFQIELIEVRLDNFRTDFNFKVPLLNGVVYFQANLVLGIFPINISGRLRVKLQNVKVDGAVGGPEIVFLPKQFYTLSSLKAHFHAENVWVSVDGFNLDQDVLEMLQPLGENTDLEPLKKAVNYYVAQEILKQLNDIIKNFSIEQVEAYLLAR